MQIIVHETYERMPSDFSIADFLDGQGFSSPESQSAARAALERAGLTRAGKARMAQEKRGRALEILEQAFVRACAAPACKRRAEAVAAGREVLEVDAEDCPHCRGSDNRRAVTELARRLPALGVERLLVLGGTPILHDKMAELLREAGGKLQVRYVDGAVGVHTRDEAAIAMRWAQVLVVWASTPLPHKVSTLYTDHPAARGPVRTVTVTQRGIAGLCGQLLAALEGK